MLLKALSMGYAIPGADFSAVVHSVFSTAINLRPATGNELLTLVASSEADLPQGIRVDTPNDFSFEVFSTGEPVICRRDSLRLKSLTVELAGARRWKCNLPALQADPANPAVKTAWTSVWLALNQRQIQAKAEILAENLFRSDDSMWAGVPRMAGTAISDLVDATRRYDLPMAASSARGLIGLGSGLTPSGDDLLVGCLAGLWCAVQNNRERVQFVSDLGKAVIHLSRRTNEISRTYLFHASQGQVSSLLANLAEAICTGMDANQLFERTNAALQVGHTSGMDAVTGLLLGLAAWEGGLIM